MCLQRPFNLLGGDVEAAGLDHVLATVAEEEVAVVVDADDIARAHPPTVEHGCGALGVIVVAEHY